MEFIDEKPVVAYKVRFQDRVEITEADARSVRDDNVIIWLLRARCLPPQYHPVSKEADERFRFNIQAVEQATPLEGAQREAALTYFEHGAHQGYLGFEAPRFDEQGLFDPRAYDISAERELQKIRDYLSELGDMHEGENLLDTLRRLIEGAGVERSGAERYFAQRLEDPEYAEAYTTAAEQMRVDVEEGEVEIVGQLHPHGRRGDTERYLAEAFGPG